MEPFVPEAEFSYPDYGSDDYSIVVLRTDDEPVVYEEGECAPLETLLEVDDARSSRADSVDEGPSSNPEERPVAEIADDADAVVARFADRFLTEEPTSTIEAGEVYDCYEQWAKQHDVDPDGKSWFARRLSNHVTFDRTTVRRDSGSARCYEGLVLDQTGGSDE